MEIIKTYYFNVYRMQVDISHISKAESGPEALYAITFTLLSGNSIKLLNIKDL
jgi:hypothetical protein